ncbi:hypothetical protein EK904_010856 [Melospiza melodia maxima]|nr:hypothetical protein EK904_010856 [Melospiza melodia maxima]
MSCLDQEIQILLFKEGGFTGTLLEQSRVQFWGVELLHARRIRQGLRKEKPRSLCLHQSAMNCPKLRNGGDRSLGRFLRKWHIQNAALLEFRIWDLNDEINKLLREKGHWEYRIKELGGPDFARIGLKMLDHEGKEVPGDRGCKYFEAAKDLPGVREIFERNPLQEVRRWRKKTSMVPMKKGLMRKVARREKVKMANRNLLHMFQCQLNSRLRKLLYEYYFSTF